MIIWGSTGREFDLATGRFHCPRCEAQVPYRHRRVARYFTLYFIPLFQIEDLGQYVECLSCKQTYKPEVLSYEPPSPVERLAAVVRNELEQGTPLDMARNKLIQQGIDEQAATALVQACQAGDSLAYCEQCRFTYLGSIPKCTGCGRPLSPVA